MTDIFDRTLDDALPPVDREALLVALREVLPPAALLTEREQLRPFECDGLPTARQVPLTV